MHTFFFMCLTRFIKTKLMFYCVNELNLVFTSIHLFTFTAAEKEMLGILLFHINMSGCKLILHTNMFGTLEALWTLVDAVTLDKTI